MPAPTGQTVQEHLARVLWAAQRVGRDARLIEAAIRACLHGKCLQGGRSAQPGTPPAGHVHAASVLLARASAAESDWDGCLAALRHGVAPTNHLKNPKAERP